LIAGKLLFACLQVQRELLRMMVMETMTMLAKYYRFAIWCDAKDLLVHFEQHLVMAAKAKRQFLWEDVTIKQRVDELLKFLVSLRNELNLDLMLRLMTMIGNLTKMTMNENSMTMMTKIQQLLTLMMELHLQLMLSLELDYDERVPLSLEQHVM
jgi:hypothetical protein